jgi:hypothetical protein
MTRNGPASKKKNDETARARPKRARERVLHAMLVSGCQRVTCGVVCEESEGSKMTRASDRLADIAFAACCRRMVRIRWCRVEQQRLR